MSDFHQLTLSTSDYVELTDVLQKAVNSAFDDLTVCDPDEAEEYQNKFQQLTTLTTRVLGSHREIDHGPVTYREEVLHNDRWNLQAEFMTKAAGEASYRMGLRSERAMLNHHIERGLEYNVTEIRLVTNRGKVILQDQVVA